MTRRLALFDIDGTLISDGGAARNAFAVALAEIYGYDGDVSGYDFSGRTDPQIAHMVLGDAGFAPSEVAERMSGLWMRYLDHLEANLRDARSRALPGIIDLVERLAGHSEVTLALLTGNIEAGARLKLSPPALNRFFPFGAFGSDSARREELPPIAVERASQIDGHRFSGADVVIIGDSIYDVRCGTPHSATTIAIASGKTQADRLKAENPDFFFDSAEPTEAIVAAIRG